LPKVNSARTRRPASQWRDCPTGFDAPLVADHDPGEVVETYLFLNESFGRLEIPRDIAHRE